MGSRGNPIHIQTYKKYPIILGFYKELHSLLFLPSEKRPLIEEQLYLFMKRFRTQPSEFFSMDDTLRLKIYFRERELIKIESEEANKLRNKKHDN